MKSLPSFLLVAALIAPVSAWAGSPDKPVANKAASTSSDKSAASKAATAPSDKSATSKTTTTTVSDKSGASKAATTPSDKPIASKAATTPYEKADADKSGADKAPLGKSQPAQTDASQADASQAKPNAGEVTTKDFSDSGIPEDSTMEKPNQVYRFVGLRFRETWIPKFMMSLFGDGGTTVGVPMVGPEFTIRKNNFEYVFSVMYSDYAMSATPFKAKSDPIQAYELVTSKLKVLYLMADFLWSTDLDQQQRFSVDYGAGLGLGIVFGDLARVQAYPGNNPDDPYSYRPCRAQGNPAGSFCADDNNHYPTNGSDYTEPSWANGGSKPIVFPWLALQTGLRWKPHRHFMTRLDLGWNLLNGPFVGIAANYGL